MVIMAIPSLMFAALLAINLFLEKKPIGHFLQQRLMWLVLPIIFINGCCYVFLLPYWSPIDEQSHFAYIQHLNDKKEIPLLTDSVSEDVVAIAYKTYPGKPPLSPLEIGLGGTNYEAFQPPLYYAASVPIYKLGGSNFINKIYLLRLWGIFQLAIVVFLTHKIFDNISSIFPVNTVFFKLSALAAVGMTPEMIERASNISNSVFPLIFVALALWWLSRFVCDSHDAVVTDAVILGIFTGLAYLSRFFSFLLFPIVLLFYAFKKNNLIINSMLFLFIALLIITPWLIFNQIHYQAFTANEQAKLSQINNVNPTGYDFDWNSAREYSGDFITGIWAGVSQPLARILITIMNLVWLAGMILGLSAAVFNLYFRRQMKKNAVCFIAGTFIVANFFTLLYGFLVSDWPMLLGRYMHSAIFAIAFFFAYGLFWINRIKLGNLMPLVVFFLSVVPLFINYDYLILLFTGVS